jgi:hypothetical protein
MELPITVDANKNFFKRPPKTHAFHNLTELYSTRLV